MRDRLFVALFVSALLAARGTADTVIESISINRAPYAHTGILRIERIGRFDDVPRLAVPTKTGELQTWDKISNNRKDLRMRLRCGTSTVDFSGPFRVIINQPGRYDCVLQLRAGRATVRSRNKTAVEVSGIAAITLGTEYTVHVNSADERLIRRVSVLEGVVGVLTEKAPETVEAGKTVEVTESGINEPRAIDSAEIASAADEAAELDVMTVLQNDGDVGAEEIKRLTALHLAALNNPYDPAQRRALAKRQREIGLIREAERNDTVAEELASFAKLDSAALCREARTLLEARQLLKARYYATLGLRREDGKLSKEERARCVGIIEPK